MLRKLLALMMEDTLLTATGLAQALDVTPAEVDVLLRDLEARGYLRAVDCAGACGRCAGCPARSCTEGETARVWTLTEKGRRAAEGVPALSTPS